MKIFVFIFIGMTNVFRTESCQGDPVTALQMGRWKAYWRERW